MARKTRTRARRQPREFTAARIAQLRGTVPAAWLESFLTIAGVKPALAELDAADQSRDKWLLRSVVKSCYNAHAFDPNAKHGPRARRKDDKKYREDIPGKAIQKLCRFFERRGDNARRDLDAAHRELRRPLPGDVVLSPAQLADLLSSFLFVLAEYPPPPFARHRFQAGPLLYRHPLDKQKREPGACENGLTFELAFLIRHATAGREPAVVEGSGASMPDFGKPHFSSIATLASAALDKTITEGAAKKKLHDLTRHAVALWRWPHS